MRRRSSRRVGMRAVAVGVLLVPLAVTGGVAGAQEPVPDVTNPAVGGGPPSAPPDAGDTAPDGVPLVEERESFETKGEIDDPAQKRLRWIIGGLVGLAVVILVATVWYWRATSPRRRSAELEAAEAPRAVPPDAPRASSLLEGVRASRPTGPLPPGHRAPIWADEHVAARGGGAATTGAADPDR